MNLKKLSILLLVTLISVTGFCQYTGATTGLGTSANIVQVRGGLKVKTLILPQYIDTFAANAAPNVKFYDGSLIAVGVDIYVRKSNGWSNTKNTILSLNAQKVLTGNGDSLDLVSTNIINRTLLVSNVALTNTGTTTENIIYTGVLPAGSIGVNGSFHITGLFSTTNNANAKTFKIKISGVIIATINFTSVNSFSTYTIIRNRNSLTVQISGGATGIGNTSFNDATAITNAVYSFDTSTALTLTVTCQNAVGTDVATIEALEIFSHF